MVCYGGINRVGIGLGLGQCKISECRVKKARVRKGVVYSNTIQEIRLPSSRKALISNSLEKEDNTFESLSPIPPPFSTAGGRQ